MRFKITHLLPNMRPALVILRLQTERYRNFLSVDMKHDMSALQNGKISPEKLGILFSTISGPGTILPVKTAPINMSVSLSAGDGVV